MPKGPQGQKRPADVIGNAVHVMRIATGQVEENPKAQKAAARAVAGKKGGAARKASLAPVKRAAIAKKAAQARWAARAKAKT